MNANTRKLFRRFRRHKGALVGLCVIGSLVLCAAFAPLVAPYSPTDQNLANGFLEPSFSHPFGTDEMGRDIFSRILFGARISILIGFVSVGIALSFGVAIGVTAGYFGGKTDLILMRGIDLMLSFPSILLAIVVVAILGPKLFNAMLAVGIVGIPEFSRLVRSATMAEKEQEHVQASIAMGAHHFRIIRKNILPNIVSPLIVQSTMRFATAILEAAALSFLGLGAQPPDIEWGLMLNSARSVMFKGWWIITFPGIAITVTVLGFNLVGDGLRDTLDPKTAKH